MNKRGSQHVFHDSYWNHRHIVDEIFNIWDALKKISDRLDKIEERIKANENKEE
jgi:hypothetical protein